MDAGGTGSRVALFELTESQRAFQAEVRALVEREVAPFAAEYNAHQVFPERSVSALAAAGLMGVQVPPEWGGRGLGALEYVLAMEEVCRACASTGVIMSVNNSLVCGPLARHGTPE